MKHNAEMGNQKQRRDKRNVQRLSKTHGDVEVSRVGFKRSRNGRIPEKEYDIVRHHLKEWRFSESTTGHGRMPISCKP